MRGLRLAWALGAGALLAALPPCTQAASTASTSAAPPRLVASQPASRYPEPLVRHLVTQDRAVRIEEEQVRGATTSIQVKPLHGGVPYSIVPPKADAPQGPGSMQGRMQWRIGTFK
jgi:hypothetical protein